MSSEIPKDPYWYSKFLINKAMQLIDNEDFYGAYLECLVESNHGHSGFTSSQYDIFLNPKNETECELSKIFEEIHRKVALGIMSQITKEIDAFDMVMRLSSVIYCLALLFENLEPKHIKEFRELTHRVKSISDNYAFYRHYENDFLALVEMPSYKDICKLGVRFTKQFGGNYITRVMLENTKHFFENLDRDNYYIKDDVFEEMQKSISTEVFLIVDLNLLSKDSSKNSLPKKFEGYDVSHIYKDYMKEIT